MNEQKNEKTPITVQVPKVLKRTLIAAAKSQDLTLSQVCRRALQDHVSEKAPQPSAR